MPGFKKSLESGMTRSIRNRLGTNRVDTVTRYETIRGSTKTRWTHPSSQDDSVNSMKISENAENDLSRSVEQSKKQTKNANFQRFL